MKAKIAGIPLKGSFQFLDTAPVPYTLNCAARNVLLTSLNGFLAKKLATTRLTSGEFSATAKLSGTSPQKFNGTIALKLVSAAGTSSKSRISLKKAAILSTIKKINGVFSVNGSLEYCGKLDDRPFSAKQALS